MSILRKPLSTLLFVSMLLMAISASTHLARAEHTYMFQSPWPPDESNIGVWSSPVVGGNYVYFQTTKIAFDPGLNHTYRNAPGGPVFTNQIIINGLCPACPPRNVIAKFDMLTMNVTMIDTHGTGDVPAAFVDGVLITVLNQDKKLTDSGTPLPKIYARDGANWSVEAYFKGYDGKYVFAQMINKRPPKKLLGCCTTYYLGNYTVLNPQTGMVVATIPFDFGKGIVYIPSRDEIIVRDALTPTTIQAKNVKTGADIWSTTVDKYLYTGDDKIFAETNNGVSAFDFNGKVLWHNDLSGDVTAFQYFGGKLFVANGSTISVFNGANGGAFVPQIQTDLPEVDSIAMSDDGLWYSTGHTYVDLLTSPQTTSIDNYMYFHDRIMPPKNIRLYSAVGRVFIDSDPPFISGDKPADMVVVTPRPMRTPQQPEATSTTPAPVETPTAPKVSVYGTALFVLVGLLAAVFILRKFLRARNNEEELPNNQNAEYVDEEHNL